MNALPKTQGIKGKQGGWTVERRQQQSRKMREDKIWLKSTGPRTAEGKAASSKNARHEDYAFHQECRADLKRINGYLRLQSYYLKTLSVYSRKGHLLDVDAQNAFESHLEFLENELDKLEWGVRFGRTLADNVTVLPNLFRQDHYPDG